jgi:hypothetical protein
MIQLKSRHVLRTQTCDTNFASLLDQADWLLRHIYMTQIVRLVSQSIKLMQWQWSELNRTVLVHVWFIGLRLVCWMVSSGTLHHVVLVRTDVSDELSASFIRVTRIGELGTTLAVTSNRRTLRRNTKWEMPSLLTWYFFAACVSC